LDDDRKLAALSTGDTEAFIRLQQAMAGPGNRSKNNAAGVK
jgi:hypothetical protein